MGIEMNHRERTASPCQRAKKRQRDAVVAAVASVGAAKPTGRIHQ
jgi:hypothetical protein